MLGARVLSLYGRDTQHAFGHLGYINILGWADPERALAAAIVTNGKPIVYPEMLRFLGLSQRITSEAPKVESPRLGGGRRRRAEGRSISSSASPM